MTGLFSTLETAFLDGLSLPGFYAPGRLPKIIYKPGVCVRKKNKGVMVMRQSYQKLGLSFYRKIGMNSRGVLHAHKDYALLFLLAGKGKLFIEKKDIHLKPGDLVLLNDSEVHQDISMEEEYCEYIEIHFNPDLLTPFSQSFNLHHCFLDRPKGEKNKLTLTKPQKGKIEKLCARLEGFFNNPFYADEVLKHTALIELVFHINQLFLRSSFLKKQAFLPDYLAGVLEYIEDNIQNELSLAILEKKFYLNRSYLGRLFQKHLGVSIHKYIIQERITRAKELLLAGKSATDACKDAGFNDYSNFRRMFKKLTGVSPSGYVKQQKKMMKPGTAGFVSTQYRRGRTGGSGAPDLAVTGLSWRPELPRAGDPVLFQATVKNNGDKSIPAGLVIGVGFIVNQTTNTWSDNYVRGLVPGESVILTANNGQNGFSTWRAEKGRHRIIAHVDDIDRISKQNKIHTRLARELIV